MKSTINLGFFNKEDARKIVTSKKYDYSSTGVAEKRKSTGEKALADLIADGHPQYIVIDCLKDKTLDETVRDDILDILFDGKFDDNEEDDLYALLEKSSGSSSKKPKPSSDGAEEVDKAKEQKSEKPVEKKLSSDDQG